MAKSTVRVIPPPAPSAYDPISVNGRRYQSIGAAFLDVPAVDALAMASNNWQWLGLVGATTDRPTPTDWDYRQLSQQSNWFIDTTLGKAIYWDATSNVWRDPITGGAV
jgi:hypothetical protein